MVALNNVCMVMTMAMYHVAYAGAYRNVSSGVAASHNISISVWRNGQPSAINSYCKPVIVTAAMLLFCNAY